MASKKKNVVIGFSVFYLAALTALAAYALHSSHVYSLPIADVVSALSIALPPLAGIALEIVLTLNQKLAAKGQLQTSRVFQVVIGFFLVFEAVLATLAGTHISPPGSLTGGLRETWEKLFRRKEEDCIKRIQDGFNCCGFSDTQDMAWPFPDAENGSDACVMKYGRDQACLGPWKEEERKVAIMLLVVPVAVFVWMVAIVLAPSSQSSWLPALSRNSTLGSEATGQRVPFPGIGYRDLEDGEDEDSLHREVTNLNKDSRLASHVESNRARSSKLAKAARWVEANDEA